VRRVVTAGVVSYLVALSLVSVIFSPRTDLEFGIHPARYLIVVYLEMAAVLTFVALNVIFVVSRLESLSHRNRSVLGGLVTLALLAFYGLTLGRSREVREALPLQDMNAHFLAEFRSVPFVFVLTPLVSLWVAACTHLGWMRKRQE